MVVKLLMAEWKKLQIIVNDFMSFRKNEVTEKSLEERKYSSLRSE